MAIPTTRTREAARITLNNDKCNGCGKCASVCKDFNLIIENGKATLTGTPVFGCIGCGHCMMICPSDAIAVEGRSLTPVELFDLPEAGSAANYDSLLAMLRRRRSIREFKDLPVEKEKIDQILEAAQTAPMGIPPSDVHVMVLSNKTATRRFATEFSDYLKEIRWMASGWFMRLMRPLWGKTTDEMMREFIHPLFNIYVDDMQKGDNWINYDAPLAIYFYGSPYSDPADPLIAATYAMLAGESLGLGTCMLGAVHPFIQNGKKARRFREKWSIKYPSREGLFVIFGYPSVKYEKGVRRTFADISRFE